MCNLDAKGEREILESTTKLLKQYLHNEINMEPQCFKELISDVLYYWVYNNKVGQQKERDIKILYNYFFRSVLDVLLLWKKDPKDLYRYYLATTLLYKGPIFRVLGFNSLEKSTVFYDDFYAHWSRIDTRKISTIESKVFKVKKYLSTTINDDEYGLYIAPLIGMKRHEEEVVFPLRLSYKDKIKLKIVQLNDEEYLVKKLDELNKNYEYPRCKILESLIVEFNFNVRKNHHK